MVMADQHHDGRILGTAGSGSPATRLRTSSARKSANGTISSPTLARSSDERENGVIDMAILSIIRRWHYRDHVSLREIAKRLGVSRNTVRRYIRAGTVLPSYPERPTSQSANQGVR